LTPIASGIGVRKHLLRPTQRHRLWTRGELSTSSVRGQMQKRGNRVDGKVTWEDMCGRWDTGVNRCAVPQLPEARGPSKAVSSGMALY